MKSRPRTISRRGFTAALSATVPAAIAMRAFAQSTPVSSPAAGGTRIFTDAMGEVEIPATPQRIVVLDGPMLDAALSVGITPIGATTGFANDPFPAYLGDLTDGIENVGTIVEPDLERIIQLDPDLIIGTKVRHEAIHPLLMEIAPTVFSETIGATWQDDFLLFTNAMNRQSEAQDVVTAFEARVNDFREATEGVRQEWAISIVRFLPDAVRLYFRGSFIGTILDTLDLPRPESQQSADTKDFSAEISAEQINLADGSHIFACAWGDPDDTPVESFASNPLWQTLDAVKNGNVYWVDDEYWMVGIGYNAANLVIDDLTSYLIEDVPPVAIPGA